MSFFFSNGGLPAKVDVVSTCPEKPVEEVKSDSNRVLTLPEVLTKAQLRSLSANLTYALPALMQSHKSAAKGGKSKKGKALHFPSPRASSALNKVYTIVQTLPPAAFSSSTTLPTFTATSVSLSVLDQVSTLIGLFDQYRIAMLEVRIVPRLTQNDTPSLVPGDFVSVVDLDDANALSTFNAALDYPSAVTTLSTREHKHTFVPHVAIAAYSGAFTSFANEAAPWIDAASSGVLHYGVKTAWQPTSTVLYQDIWIRMLVQFRNVH